jgi:hypothetical protein
MGMIRSVRGRGEKSVQGFFWESLKEKHHLEDRGLDRRMGSEQILGGYFGGVMSVQLARDRNRW